MFKTISRGVAAAATTLVAVTATLVCPTAAQAATGPTVRYPCPSSGILSLVQATTDVNLRSGRGTSYPVRGVLPAGKYAVLLQTNLRLYTWWEVNTPATGNVYVNRNYAPGPYLWRCNPGQLVTI
jgi:uncharacterized protein YgiM (DUF1202 family)